MLAGQAMGGVNAIRPAKVIIEDMVAQAVAILRRSHSLIARL
jgi:hypothetical protein